MNDHGLKVYWPTDGSCEIPTMKRPIDDNLWRVLQFHIHTSSEHALDGKLYGAEMHIVHYRVDPDTDGPDTSQLSVVGLFMEPSEAPDNYNFGPLLSGWDAIHAEAQQNCSVAGAPETIPAVVSGGVMNPYALIPGGATMYTLNGSLTTPPCSEIVAWNVVDTPVKMNVRDYSRVVNLILGYIDGDEGCTGTVASVSGSTSRPPMPLNGRTVTRICPVGFEEVGGPNPGASSSSVVSVMTAAFIAGLAMLM